MIFVPLKALLELSSLTINYHSDQHLFFVYGYTANVLLSTIILQLVNMSKSRNNVHLITIIWSWKNAKLGRHVPLGVTDD